MIKSLLCLAVQRAVACEMRGGDCKNLLYATFVKTVTATRWLERMFPIHALYRLITGPTFCTAEHIARKKSCASVYLSVKRVDHPHATSHAPLCWYFTGHFKSSVLHFPIILLLPLWQLFQPIFYLFTLCSFVSSIEATQAYHLCAMQLQKMDFSYNRFLVRPPESRGEQWTN